MSPADAQESRFDPPGPHAVHLAMREPHAAQFTPPGRTLKLVYWGPGRSGKTTNLVHLHGRLRPDLKGRLITLDSPGERTIYFDCLPLDLYPQEGAGVRLRLYTVPGQPRFARTRRLVLQGASGVVFVWDSRRRRLRANLESLLELRCTLDEMGRPWRSVPAVIQFNKQDHGEKMEPDLLEAVLARAGDASPRLVSVAVEGTGVLDTLKLITRVALQARLSHPGALSHQVGA